MSWVTPIFNRTEEDLNTAKVIINKINTKGYNQLTAEEKDLFDNGLIACRNATDLNRIENNCQYLSKSFGIDFGEPVVWDYGETPMDFDIIRILDNIAFIGYVLYGITGITITDIPDIPINTIDKMNDLEKVLYNIYESISEFVTWSDLDNMNYTWNSLDEERIVWKEYY